MSPAISVILPSYQVAPYIRECVESALDQTQQEMEILCVDARSEDGTLEILREYEERAAQISGSIVSMLRIKD